MFGKNGKITVRQKVEITARLRQDEPPQDYHKTQRPIGQNLSKMGVIFIFVGIFVGIKVLHHL